ncbi:MAG: hypothetical protein IPI29_08600 [Ignavibacteria bacterium]|nr:hypothetical protein [Ignavibacteria bacterium]
MPSWVPTARLSFPAIATGTNATATMTVNNGIDLASGTAGATHSVERACYELIG